MLPELLTGTFTLEVTDINEDVISSFPLDSTTLLVYSNTLSSPGVWLLTLVLVVAAILPDVAIRVLRKHWLSIQVGAKV